MSDKSRFRLPFLKSSPVVPLVRLEGAISATPSRFDRALNLAGVGDALVLRPTRPRFFPLPG